jgi:hypothetical protein
MGKDKHYTKGYNDGDSDAWYNNYNPPALRNSDNSGLKEYNAGFTVSAKQHGAVFGS